MNHERGFPFVQRLQPVLSGRQYRGGEAAGPQYLYVPMTSGPQDEPPQYLIPISVVCPDPRRPSQGIQVERLAGSARQHIPFHKIRSAAIARATEGRDRSSRDGLQALRKPLLRQDPAVIEDDRCNHVLNYTPEGHGAARGCTPYQLHDLNRWLWDEYGNGTLKLKPPREGSMVKSRASHPSGDFALLGPGEGS